MDKKTGGIIATIVAVLLCGCPGLCFCLFGAVTAISSLYRDQICDIFGVAIHSQPCHWASVWFV